MLSRGLSTAQLLGGRAGVRALIRVSYVELTHEPGTQALGAGLQRVVAEHLPDLVGTDDDAALFRAPKLGGNPLGTEPRVLDENATIRCSTIFESWLGIRGWRRSRGRAASQGRGGRPDVSRRGATWSLGTASHRRTSSTHSPTSPVGPSAWRLCRHGCWQRLAARPTACSGERGRDCRGTARGSGS
jgi:hypothetical protein